MFSRTVGLSLPLWGRRSLRTFSSVGQRAGIITQLATRGQQETSKSLCSCFCIRISPEEVEPYGPVTGRHGRYNHPVRLLWPISKCSEHLFEAGEALLTNFPVQATISFYEESDSESEADSGDESQDSGIELE